MLLIVMQKETGSALVYSALMLVLYREGMPGCLLFTVIAAVVYFVVGIRYADAPLLGAEQMSLGHTLVMLLIQVFTVGLLWVYCKEARVEARRMLLRLLTADAVLVGVCRWLWPEGLNWLLAGLTSLVCLRLLYLSLRDRAVPYLLIALFSVGSLGLHYSANIVMNDVLKPYQQKRIRVLLGLEDDPRGTGYNVLQAKIAIGSGGLRGKGFLNGTQTKLKYVPEQDTDFIFCTVGEEEGFLGCAVVLLLLLALILRLMHLAERQPFTFGRVYGYCVLSIFLFHVFINVGMVLGLTPVIGIPLPFFSYGGSSLWGFTILLFVFLRIDAGRNRLQR